MKSLTIKNIGLDVISVHVFLSLIDILQELFFTLWQTNLHILNIRGTYFATVNK